jgi:hypothetical protein
MARMEFGDMYSCQLVGRTDHHLLLHRLYFRYPFQPGTSSMTFACLTFCTTSFTFSR